MTGNWEFVHFVYCPVVDGHTNCRLSHHNVAFMAIHGMRRHIRWMHSNCMHRLCSNLNINPIVKMIWLRNTFISMFSRACRRHMQFEPFICSIWEVALFFGWLVLPVSQNLEPRSVLSVPQRSPIERINNTADICVSTETLSMISDWVEWVDFRSFNQHAVHIHFYRGGLL